MSSLFPAKADAEAKAAARAGQPLPPTAAVAASARFGRTSECAANADRTNTFGLPAGFLFRVNVELQQDCRDRGM